MTPKNFSFRRRGGLWLGLCLFFLFLLISSREPPHADARPIWQVARSLVVRGTLNIHIRWPETLPLGSDGKTYAAAPLLQSLVHLPGSIAIQVLGGPTTRAGRLALPLMSHLAPSALAALTAVLFFGLCRLARLCWQAAALGTGMVALGTIVTVYARSPYSEMLQAACFTATFAFVIKTRVAPTRWNALWLGVWAGLLVATKLVYGTTLIGAAVYLLLALRSRRDLLTVLAWGTAGLVPSLVLILGYNYARWGSVAATGYDVASALGHENVLVGLWGLFLSPGKSLFLFSPPLVLSAIALPRLWRRHQQLAWAMIATIVPAVLTNATLLFWSGDYAWGPRYLVFATPVMMLPACVLLHDLFQAAPSTRRRWAAGAVACVAAAGVWVQTLGSTFFWDHFIRIQMEARSAWLGEPDTSGTRFPDFGGVCGACFEDLHGLQWLPPFSAIDGHWWLLRHVPRRHDWVKAELDAPWRRYTSVRLTIPFGYEQARVDWWYLDFRGQSRGMGLTLLLALSLGLLAAGELARRELGRTARAARPADEPPGGGRVRA